MVTDSAENDNDSDIDTQREQIIYNLELEDKSKEAFLHDKTTHFEAIKPKAMFLTKIRHLISIFQHFNKNKSKTNKSMLSRVCSVLFIQRQRPAT